MKGHFETPVGEHATDGAISSILEVSTFVSKWTNKTFSHRTHYRLNKECYDNILRGQKRVISYKYKQWGGAQGERKFVSFVGPYQEQIDKQLLQDECDVK